MGIEGQQRGTGFSPALLTLQDGYDHRPCEKLRRCEFVYAPAQIRQVPERKHAEVIFRNRRRKEKRKNEY